MSPQPNNQHSDANPVGRFMVAVGTVLLHPSEPKILLLQRAATLDWQPNEWETCYGRIAQHEDPEVGLRRELHEETGITAFEILHPITAWHLYRGEVSVENDLIGITYLCQAQPEALQQLRTSDEHQAHRWVSFEEALELVSIEGIRRDITAYMNLRSA